jgi:hypothetical protein
MSIDYDRYLQQHISSVEKGFRWMQENIEDLFIDPDLETKAEEIILNHDKSKTELDEYEPYDAYFYGGNRSYKVVEDFRKAWLIHIHRNPHHWQHWVLINDDPKEGEIIMEMPYVHIIEMICDWWAFSWIKGDLTEIFTWYDAHKDYMKLHKNTKATVESLLEEMKKKIDTPNTTNE